MSWYNKVSGAPTPGSANAGRWSGDFDFADRGGQSVSPAEPLPSSAIEDPKRMAGGGTQAIASLPTDLDTRARYYAEKRGIPIDKYFFVNDRLAYKAGDGKAYFEEPRFRAPGSLPEIPAALQQSGKAAASLAGPAMSPIGGMAAAAPFVMAGPPGWLTGAGAATLGGGSMDAVRQFLANKLTGEEKPWSDRAMQTGGAALQEGVGQIAGNGFIRALSRFGRTPTYNIPETTRVRELADRFGIRLTPGEETGNRTLIRRQKILANTTEGEERFTQFYEGRNDDVGRAVNDVLGRLSPQRSPHMGNASGVQGANAAMEAERTRLSNLARPLYQQAETGSVPPDQLLGGPASGRIQTAIDAVRAAPVYRDTVAAAPNDSIVLVDAAKKWIDDQVAAAQRAGNNNEARLWRDAAEELRTTADANVPAYGQARQIFEDNVPTRTALENGQVGTIAALQGEQVNRAGKVIFGPNSSAEDIRFAREAFERAGAIPEWEAMGRAYLQQAFNEIPDSAVGSITNLGGAFRKAIMGNTRKREQITAAFEHNPAFLNEFQELMTVLDVTGRAMKGESITAFAQAGQKELEREAKGIAPALLETIEVWKTPSRLAQYWNDLRTGQYSARQAELLTTPEGREVMREMHRLGPTSSGSAIALSHFLMMPAAVGGVEAVAKPRRNGPVVSPETTLPRPPPGLSGSRQ